MSNSTDTKMDVWTNIRQIGYIFEDLDVTDENVANKVIEKLGGDVDKFNKACELLMDIFN